MNTPKTYEPTKCANTECAFPTLICSDCLCNKSTKGKAAQIVKHAKSRYAWVRSLKLTKLL